MPLVILLHYCIVYHTVVFNVSVSFLALAKRHVVTGWDSQLSVLLLIFYRLDVTGLGYISLMLAFGQEQKSLLEVHWFSNFLLEVGNRRRAIVLKEESGQLNRAQSEHSCIAKIREEGCKSFTCGIAKTREKG